MTIQFSIIAIYFVLVYIIGSKVSRKINDKEFLGHQMGIWYVVFASAGEWLGGTATAGVTEYGFIFGLSGAWYTIANALGIVFLAIFLVKLYRRIGRMTIGGIVEFYFGRRAQFASSIVMIFMLLAVGVSQLIAAGKIGQSLLGVDFAFSAIICVLLFLICTIGGGMRAIAHTNMFHMLIMYIGFIVAIVFYIHVFGGIKQFENCTSVVAENIGVNLFSMKEMGGTKISSWVIASVLGAATAQAGIQPILVSKDDATARKACILIAIIVAPFGILTATLGIIGRVLNEQGCLYGIDGMQITDSKIALSTLTAHLPPILSGIVLSAEFAAILSTIAPIILAIGTIVIKDILPNLFPGSHEERHEVEYLRKTLICVGGVICGVAICIEKQVHLLDMVYSAYSLRSVLFLIILSGIFLKNLNSLDINLILICSWGITIYWTLYKILIGHYPIADWFTETYATLAFSISSLLLINLYHKLSKYKDLKPSH